MPIARRIRYTAYRAANCRVGTSDENHLRLNGRPEERRTKNLLVVIAASIENGIEWIKSWIPAPSPSSGNGTVVPAPYIDPRKCHEPMGAISIWIACDG